MRRLSVAVAILGAGLWAACEAQAQTTCATPKPGADWVCVGGGWLPPGHPSIPTTATPTPGPQPVDVTQALTDALAECQLLNPYQDPVRVMRCVELVERAKRAVNPPILKPMVFELGVVYYRAYPTDRYRVIGLTTASDGVEVVTLESLQYAGVVTAYRNIPLRDGLSVWIRSPEQ